MSEAIANTPAVTPLQLIENANEKTMSNQIHAITKFQGIVNQQLTSDVDYGVIPNTKKPTLLKPGAEKILMLMGLTSEYEIVDKVEDQNGDGYFDYTVRCTLTQGTQVVTQGLGSANTKETRYRLNTYKDGKKEPWDGVSYQDAHTLKNTVLKMAKKRAQIDATLTVASLSNVFTQDIEDMGGLSGNGNSHETAEDGSLILGFGKYKGKSILQILNENRSYVEWLADKGKTEEVKKAAEKALKGGQQENNHEAMPDNNSIGKLVALSKQLAKITNADPAQPANEVLKKLDSKWTGSDDDWTFITSDLVNGAIKELTDMAGSFNKQPKDPFDKKNSKPIADDDLPFSN